MSGTNRQATRERIETYQQRARRYERIEKTTTWIGAGLVGLIALVGADVVDPAPSWLMASVVTLIVLGGGLLAQTRILFEWHATVLKRAIEDDDSKKTEELPADLQSMPKLGKPMFVASLLLTVAAGLLIVVGAWWPVLHPPVSFRCMMAWIQGAATGAPGACQGMSLEQWALIAQIASAIATVILAAAVFVQIRAAREQAAATRATVREMEENRLAQERPQVIVETDHSRPPFVFVVVRNIGKGAARDITFRFSAPVESPQSADPHSLVIPVNEQPYFQRGMDYLAPGAEISCLWGSMIDLADFLRERGLDEGIEVTSRYRSLAGELFESQWVLNPLLVASRISLADEKGVKDIAEATEKIAKILNKSVSSLHNELKVTTYEERQRRALLLEQMRNLLKEKLRNSGSGDPSQVRVNRHEIESIGQNSHTAAKLFETYLNIPGYWHGEYGDLDETGEWTSVRLTNVM